jgi:disulfide oxidoreductase YuzD
VRAEIERRYGDDAQVLYHNVEVGDVRQTHSTLVDEIENRGLLYPVTVVDGVPVYDGAVSYPAIMRAVHNKLLEREGAANA